MQDAKELVCIFEPLEQLGCKSAAVVQAVLQASVSCTGACCSAEKHHPYLPTVHRYLCGRQMCTTRMRPGSAWGRSLADDRHADSC